MLHILQIRFIIILRFILSRLFEMNESALQALLTVNVLL